MSATIIPITVEDGEFRVPHPNGLEEAAYYCTDYEDARGTAQEMWKDFPDLIMQTFDPITE